MFERVFDSLACENLQVSERSDGVAFLKAAQELYGFSSIMYLGFNIELTAGSQLHCCYSDSRVRHCVTRDRVDQEFLERNRIAASEPVEIPRASAECPAYRDKRFIAYPLTPRGKETAFVGIEAAMSVSDWERHKLTGLRDIRVLGNYFHSHILRINGHDADRDMLVSARELDCLKWTAAGKTAWEASIILGISERTVRFHLNAAREKLKCATTTQAVAKAIKHELIDIAGV